MASSLALLQLLLFYLAPLAFVRGDVRWGDCSTATCNDVASVDNAWSGPAPDPNKALGSEAGWILLRSFTGTRRGINHGFYSFVNAANVVKGDPATTLKDCCTACSLNARCVYYQFFQSVQAASKHEGYNNLPADKRTRCLLLARKAGRTPPPKYSISTPEPYTGDQQAALVTAITVNPNDPVAKAQAAAKMSAFFPGRDIGEFAYSYVGGYCGVSIVNDPHLTGGHGTPFDFNGKLDKAFCLTTDKNLQINVVLRGYEDARTNGATVQADGKALRSWIKEVGILWASADGKKHSLHLVARNGNQQERGDGFLAEVRVDGQSKALPKVSDSVRGEGGLLLTLAAVEKTGPFDADMFTLHIDGVADMELRMRVAHPALQTPEDAQAHFNLYLTDIRATEAIHGVLGQTFRSEENRVERAVKYSEIASLLHAPVAADGATGKGFLDGSVEDYVTPDVLSPGCKFSAFST